MESLKITDISGNEAVYRAYFNQHNLGELLTLPEIKLTASANEYQIYSPDDSMGKNLKLNYVRHARISLRCLDINGTLALMDQYINSGGHELRLEPFAAYRGPAVSFTNCEFLPEAKLILGGRSGRCIEVNFLAKTSDHNTKLFICT